MRTILLLSAGVLAASALSACESVPEYASACERDYAENRNRAIAAGALLGAAAGAAIDDRNDARGAAIGAAVGGLIGGQLSREDDPCGYGFGGYARDGRYAAYQNDPYYGRTDGYYDSRGRWRRR